MSDWDISYHRERLEQHSGRKWIPEPPRSFDACVQAEQRAAGVLAAATITLRVLGAITAAGVTSTTVGAALGIWSGLTDTPLRGGLVPALCWFGVLALVVCGALWVVGRLRFLPDLQNAQSSAQAAVTAASERVIYNDATDRIEGDR